MVRPIPHDHLKLVEPKKPDLYDELRKSGDPYDQLGSAWHRAEAYRSEPWTTDDEEGVSGYMRELRFPDGLKICGIGAGAALLVLAVHFFGWL